MSLKDAIKIKSDIEKNHSTVELYYTHVALQVIQVFALGGILDQLTRLLVTSKGQTDS
jgi:hypothetical protein